MTGRSQRADDGSMGGSRHGPTTDSGPSDGYLRLAEPADPADPDILALVGLSIPVLGVLGLFGLSSGLRNLVGDTLGGIEGVIVLSDNALSPVLSNLPASPGRAT